MGSFASSFAFPFGYDGTGPAYAQPFDHIARGKARLLVQYRHRPLLNGLVGALLRGAQDVEDVLYQMLTERLLDGSVGVQVDVLGALRNAEREGRTDGAFLKLIQTLALAYKSSGAVPEIYAMLERIAPGGAFAVEQLIHDDAGFGVSFTDPALPPTPASPDDLTPELLQRLLREARAAGVRLWFYWWPRDASELFTLCEGDDQLPDAARGFADDAETTGGRLAGEVIA